MVNDLGERLRKARENMSLSQSELAEKLGLGSATVVSRYETGQREPDISTLVKFAKLSKTRLDWLLGGEEAAPEVSLQAALMVKESTEDYGDFCFIPQVRGEISAGGGLIPDDTIEMKIAFRREWIQRRGDPRSMSLIRVTGDSMEPTLVSGDIVLVDHNRNYIDPQGGIYALTMNHTIMIKRIQVIHTTGKLRIISDNSRYDAIEADPARVTINGKVIWYGREIER